MIIAKPKNFDLDQIYASGQCFRWEKRQAGGYYLPIGNGNNKISIWDDEKGFYSGEPCVRQMEITDFPEVMP